MSALILAAAMADTSRPVSAVLWWAGGIAQLVLTRGVLRVWIADPRFEPGHVHPAWFIPVVGNLVVPPAGTAHAPAEMSWFFVAVGLGFWLALLPVVLNRRFLHGPLAPKLMPTLAILVAPPALAYLSWLRLGGAATDPAARILLHLATFQALLLIVEASALRKLPFTLSAWATAVLQVRSGHEGSAAAIADALTAAAHERDAAALVVGSRGLRCDRTGVVDRVVVGFDGSRPAVAALRWAADEARLRQAQLVARTIDDGSGEHSGPKVRCSPGAIRYRSSARPATSLSACARRAGRGICSFSVPEPGPLSPSWYSARSAAPA